MSIFKSKKVENNVKGFTVCGIVEIDEKILLVRHTYGTAKDRILLPGGYVKQGELPTTAAEREIFEETGVSCKAEELFSMQFKSEQWCAVFKMKYISGKPKSDGYENSEVLLLSAEEALSRNDLTNMSREILKAYNNVDNGLKKSNYIAKSCSESDYALFMNGCL